MRHFWPFLPKWPDLAVCGIELFELEGTLYHRRPTSVGLGAPSERPRLASLAKLDQLTGAVLELRELRFFGVELLWVLRTRLPPGETEICPRFRSGNAENLRFSAIYRAKASDFAPFGRTLAFYVSHFRAKLWVGFGAQAHF